MVGIVIVFIIGVFIFSYSPTIAIRKHLFISNPVQSFTCNLKKTTFIDNRYGQQYIVEGFIDKSSGGGIHFAYVKKNSLGLYYWFGGGSGP